MDDERNTDNAWIETSVINYHDNDGDVIDKFIVEVVFSTHIVKLFLLGTLSLL